jgi:hypothetical protein
VLGAHYTGNLSVQLDPYTGLQAEPRHNARGDQRPLPRQQRARCPANRGHIGSLTSGGPPKRAAERGWAVEPALDGTYLLRDERGTLQAADWLSDGFGLSLEEIELALASL